MASVGSGYPVPKQPLLFGLQVPQKRATIPRRELEKRLDNLRKVKLELEEECERKKSAIKFLTKRLDTVNTAMYSQGLAHKMLFKSEEQVKRARLRMKELWKRCEQTEKDNDRLQNTIDRFKDEYRCQGPCGKVRSYKCFARDPDHITGRERRCNLCQKEKTAKWRLAKKVVQQ